MRVVRTLLERSTLENTSRDIFLTREDRIMRLVLFSGPKSTEFGNRTIQALQEWSVPAVLTVLRNPFKNQLLLLT